MQGIQAFVRSLADLDIGVVWTLLAFIAIESLAPRAGAKVSAASRLRAVVFWSVYNVAILVLFLVIWPIWSALGVKPLLPSLAPPGLPRPVSVLIGCIAAAYIGDFVYYWCHRIQHRYLWRFHAIHHSVREMSGMTAYHHFTEELMKLVLYTVPLSFVTQDPFAIPVLGAAIAFQGNYLHSPTWINFGPLGRYFIDNRFHRIHHSMEPRHFDKNFGVFTTLWDSVFGTAYFPAPGEWPETGVADYPEPATVDEFLLAPFTWRKGAAVAPTDHLASERA